MSRKNSITATFEEVKKLYEEGVEKEMRFTETLKLRGEDITIQSIVSNYCHMQHSGERTCKFECCRLGCAAYPCQ